MFSAMPFDSIGLSCPITETISAECRSECKTCLKVQTPQQSLQKKEKKRIMNIVSISPLLYVQEPVWALGNQRCEKRECKA